jgi:predicted nicotinamide N-methyase
VKSFFYSNDYPHQPSSFDCVLAVDAFFDKTDYHNAFEFKTIPTNGKRLALVIYRMI